MLELVRILCLPVNAVDPCIYPVSRFCGHNRVPDHNPVRSPVAAANVHASLSGRSADEDGAAEMVTGCRRADDGENLAERGVVVEMGNDGGGRGRGLEVHPSSQSRNQNRKRWTNQCPKRNCRRTTIQPPALRVVVP